MPTEGEITGAMRLLSIGRKEAATVDYMGDGVYASFDGYQVWARTLPGPYPTAGEKVALEPNVMQNLIEYAKQKGAIAP